MKNPSVISLCTGYGGLETGLANYYGSASVVANVEIEAYPNAVIMKRSKQYPIIFFI